MGHSMSTVLSTVHISALVRPSLSTGKNAQASFFFGRSVYNNMDSNIMNSNIGMVRRPDKEPTQSELNQKHPQNHEWESHCQFYADCADCQQFKQQPDNPIEAFLAHASEKPANNREGCQRIKPTEVSTNQPNCHARIAKR